MKRMMMWVMVALLLAVGGAGAAENSADGKKPGAAAQTSSSYDFSKVKLPLEYKNLDFKSYLYGYKRGYEWGRKGQQTSFPFHGIENEYAVMAGFFCGQYDGLKGSNPK